MKKNGDGASSTAGLHVAPLSVERANATWFVRSSKDRHHATYAFRDPWPANRGTEAWPSAGVLPTICRGDHVGVAALMLSE